MCWDQLIPQLVVFLFVELVYCVSRSHSLLPRRLAVPLQIAIVFLLILRWLLFWFGHQPFGCLRWPQMQPFDPWVLLRGYSSQTVPLAGSAFLSQLESLN